jgi:hypothetical protein
MMTTEQEIAERRRTIGVLKTMLAALAAAQADETAAEGGAQDRAPSSMASAIKGYARLPLR